MKTKNEGENPCSGNYAAPKPEPMAIDHAGSLPWPMDDVDSMEANVLVPRRPGQRKNQASQYQTWILFKGSYCRKKGDNSIVRIGHAWSQVIDMT